MLLALLGISFDPVQPPLTDTIWVYEHADDPSNDEFVRVWGVGGEALPKDSGGLSDFGLGLIQWDVSAVPKGRKLKSAKLTVTSVADPKYTEDESKKFPLQARATTPGFSEKTWKFDAASSFFPKVDKEAVFGGGAASPFPKPGAEFPISIDLLKGPGDFRSYLNQAETSNKPLALALTTELDVQLNPDAQTIYKFFSRHAPKDSEKPVLELTFE